MNRYSETQLEQDMNALRDDTPEMPEHLHEAWMQRIENEPQEMITRRTGWRTKVTRMAAWAAAAVFVITGATITAGSLSQTGPLSATETAGDMMMYSRAAGGSNGSYESYDSYDGGVMLTASSGAAAKAAPQQQERKIIRTVSMTIAAEDFPGTLSGLREACESSGGWVEMVSESGEEGHRRARLTLRIPAEEVDAFLTSAGSSGRITSRSETSVDVTTSYDDTKGRLDSQKALLNRLMELVPMAESLEDVLALETQIADTQYEIDRLQESLLQTDRQVDYATVEITLNEETPADQAADTKLSLTERLQAALTTGAETFLGFLQDAAVWLVSAVPFAAVAAAVGLTAHIIIRKRKKK